MKRMISVVIILSVLVSTTFSVCGYSGNEHGYNWNLDTETGILVISGNVAMEDYTNGDCPAYAGCINNTYPGPLAKYVYFEEGITHVSSYALNAGFPNMNHGPRYSCYNVIEVYLASTVESVGNYAFNSKMEKLYVYSEFVEFGIGAVPSSAIIYGYEGTNIESFARENGNEFVAMCREHTETLINILEPGCTTDGYTGDCICTVCNITTLKGEVIPALGHDYSLVDISEPDCTNDGYSGDVQCSRCSDVSEHGEIIPATGHHWSDWSVVTNPTCTAEGVKIRFCSGCEEQEKGTIQPMGHITKKTEPTEASCTENGNIAYWSCIVCNKHYSDIELTTETELADTIIPATGHDISDWTVTKEATFTTEGKKVKKCMICGLETESEIIPLLTNPFTDVSENAWYTKSVRYCFEKGYMNGMSEALFSPNSNVTREQFVMILANISGINTEEYKLADSGMNDVPTGKWYSGAVAWAVSEGYVTGVAEGVFGLGQPIQRAALARLLYLYAEKNGFDVSSRSNLSVYDDYGKVEPWMEDGLSWAVSNSIITSASSDTLVLNPRHSATRAQCARMLMVFDTIEKTE